MHARTIMQFVSSIILGMVAFMELVLFGMRQARDMKVSQVEVQGEPVKFLVVVVFGRHGRRGRQSCGGATPTERLRRRAFF